jgi:hypothetical protein
MTRSMSVRTLSPLLVVFSSTRRSSRLSRPRVSPLLDHVVSRTTKSNIPPTKRLVDGREHLACLVQLADRFHPLHTAPLHPSPTPFVHCFTKFCVSFQETIASLYHYEIVLTCSMPSVQCCLTDGSSCDEMILTFATQTTTGGHTICDIGPNRAHAIIIMLSFACQH